MILSENLLTEAHDIFSKNSNIVALYVPEIVTGEKFFSKVRRYERGFYDGTVIDGVRFVRKDIFQKIGGFDEKLYACEDWDLDKRLKKFGRFATTKSVLFHNESEFDLRKYLAKKSYYAENFDTYIEKWGRNDPDIKKQFGFRYRFFGVFTENGKWKKLLHHPSLTLGMFFLRVMVGVKYLTR
jgi:GT2 family glycosyltransferase